MKKVFTILAAVLLTATVWAQSPEKMSYQAVVRDLNDNLVTSQAVGIKISILQGSVSGSSVYEETYNPNPSTNTNGLVTVEIGDGIPILGNFTLIDWSNGPYFIKTEIDTAGGTNYTITGTSQLLSVPYALHAKTAETVTGSSVTTYSVGDFAQGGIVFWVDETGQHGLVAAKEDQDDGSGIQWYNGSYTDTEAHGDGVYAGEMNTMLIIANQGSNSNDYAAGVCANYTVTESDVTYGDWYLPSKEELNLMYQNKEDIDATAGNNGGSGFASYYYWSSTEDNNNNAWLQYFDNGGQEDALKHAPFRVRAVRAF